MNISLNMNAGANFILPALAAASLAAGLTWILNRFTVQNKSYIVYVAPLAEEVLKTLPALWVGASLFFTHVFFGMIEAVWEMFAQRRNGFYAGLAALASHSVFGFVTVLVYERYASVPPAILAGYLAHAAWNYLAVNLGNWRRHR